MSSQNSFPRPAGARPVATPTDQERLRQPSWVNPQAQPGFPQQSADAWPPQQGGGFQGGGFGQPADYGQPQQAPQQPDYGHWGSLQGGPSGQSSPARTDPYAPQFEPYTAPGGTPYGRQQQASGYGQQPAAPQWPGRGGSNDPRGFDAGSGYGGPGYAQAQPGQGSGYSDGYNEPELSAADWAGQPSEFGHDPYQQNARGGADLGFATAEGGELDQAYAEDDLEYEDEDAPRSRRPLMVVVALAGAILIGGGMAYGYKKLSSTAPQGDPPIIKSEDFPSKTKPADAGGKTFPYSDTKIMGRLGDGTSSAPADGSPDQAAPAPSDTAQATPPDDSANDGGPRKVSTLVVGRDGSIQAPPPEPPAPSSQVAVPGTSLVDAFGQNGGGQAQGRDEPLPQPRQGRSVSGDDTPVPMKKAAAAAPIKVSKINSVSGTKPPTTGSIGERDDAAAPAASKKLKKVARAEPATTSDAYSESAPVTSSGGAGYVAVLASIPHSGSSRIDALKRFADMQQKYSTALAGKTPDISSANLGAKGNFDRLVVGPPGSRQEANSVCSQLKAEGYTSCWVTTY